MVNRLIKLTVCEHFFSEQGTSLSGLFFLIDFLYLQIFRPEGITSGNQTFRHLHDSLRRQRDGYRYGNQRAVSPEFVEQYLL